MARVRTLLSSSTDETSATAILPLTRQQVVGQISVTGTQTVTLQGRMSSDHDWVTIQATAATVSFLFTLLPELQVVTTGTSGGSSITTIAF